MIHGLTDATVIGRSGVIVTVIAGLPTTSKVILNRLSLACSFTILRHPVHSRRGIHLQDDDNVRVDR